ncbi:Solute carrier family 35 member G1 [Holothuria leucospilota]|uniref:Solute carrier family 35 member G1 n=1 Tax=Holothuria leucospilota TaxID=206669 RepID=A0A9Q1C422_HOLLE|nr:Solute carrier family 35 member G1 [Holothuria leucospilota]
MERKVNHSDFRRSDRTNFECREHWGEKQKASKNGSNPEDDKFFLHLWKRLIKHRCVLLVLLGAFCSALQSIFVRYAKEDVHAMQVSCIRFFLQLSIPIPVMTYRNISPKPESGRVFTLLLLRGTFGMISLTCFFYSFYYMRVGDATTIMFGSPVFVGIFARIIMKEAFGVVDIMLVFIAIGGVFLISQPPFLFGNDVEGNPYPAEFIGAIFAFIACVCVSFTTVIMRRLGTMNVDSFKTVFYFASIACSGTALLATMLGVWTIPPCGFVRLALVAMGASSCISQCLITYSLSVERSVFVSILRTNEVLFAFILEYLLFRDFPGFLSLLGVFLVMTASVLACLKKMMKSKRKDSIEKDEKETFVQVYEKEYCVKESVV